MRMHTASGRSRWPYVIGGGILVVALVGGVAYATTRPAETPPAASTSSTPTSTPTPGGETGAGDNENDVAPTGCLGGPERTSAMVLAAQQQAKHTTYGAVEVATSFYRFIWQTPNPTTAELDAVSAQAISVDANPEFKNLAASYAGVGDMTGGQVPAGSAFHLSSTKGLWMVSENSTADRVEVSMAQGYVIDGALSPTAVAVISMTMVWEAGTWHLLEGGTPDQTKLANGGTRYTGGC